MTIYRAGVIGLGRMGSTFDDEITQGGSIFLPYCHGPTYHAAPNVELASGDGSACRTGSDFRRTMGAEFGTYLQRLS